MSLEGFIHEGLSSFRQAFPRKRTWLMFTMVVMSFIACWHIDGVSSWCRTWGWLANGYDQLLNFFRTTGFSVAQLEICWWDFVLRQSVGVESDGRLVLLADHTTWAKEGRRSPGVVNIHQDSQTQRKPSYFRGHYWGGLGLLIGDLKGYFCLPLSLRLHQGENQWAPKDSSQEKSKEVLGTKIMKMALAFARNSGKPCIVVLDAFFGSKCVFDAARSLYCIAIKAPCVEVITRAKTNYVAYLPAPPKEPGKRGRPLIYGGKINLYSLFSGQPELFETIQCNVYGQCEEIKLYYYNLMWKPVMRQIRFVFAQTSRGPIVLMCSNLTQSPIAALELYCARTRIETLFFTLKNVMGSFAYRFWTKALKPCSRIPNKNKNNVTPELTEKARQKVTSCWQAYERFMLCGCIATGLLQLCALKFPKQIWQQHSLFLRTQSRLIPSERTVKAVLAPKLVAIFLNVASNADFMKILAQKIWQKSDDMELKTQSPPDNECQKAA